MALKTTSILLFLHLFIGSFGVRHGPDDDILCLKSIKDSLDDPLGRLQSWDFTNTSIGVICKFVGVSCWNDCENRIIYLELRDMGLKGNFPRGLKYCKSLNKLDLAGNHLSGTIPSDIDNLVPYVTSLDLSGNNFSGEIPKSLANCSYLNILDLHHNQLTGNLPMELGLLSRIRRFNVADNLLSGQVPEFLTGEITEDSYANNGKLCGRPLKRCRIKHERNPEEWFEIGFGIGYVVSAVSVFVSFTVSWLQVKNVIRMVLLSMVARISRRNKDGQIFHFPSQKHKNEILELEKLVHKMSFTELCKATNNFSEDNVIGEGKMGTMYKATLQNGWFLSVKKLCDSPQFESQYTSELLALSRMRHDNLIPLLGFCMENNERLLVYKYMANGNLHDCLHPEQEEAKILEWPLRIKIAMGIARGLAWLHHKCNFRVVHHNITSRCVLLDRYFEPKISNFGAAIISNYGGTMFVYPSENDSGLFVNSGIWESDFVKKDVYGFGMVLLEMITGRETITSSTRCSSLHSTLVEWINHVATSPGVFTDGIDKNLIGQGHDGEIVEVLRIASECVHPFPYERPTMLQVYTSISHIGDRYGIPCDFGMLLQPSRS